MLAAGLKSHKDTWGEIWGDLRETCRNTGSSSRREENRCMLLQQWDFVNLPRKEEGGNWRNRREGWGGAEGAEKRGWVHDLMRKPSREVTEFLEGTNVFLLICKITYAVSWYVLGECLYIVPIWEWEHAILAFFQPPERLPIIIL